MAETEMQELFDETFDAFKEKVGVGKSNYGIHPKFFIGSGQDTSQSSQIIAQYIVCRVSADQDDFDEAGRRLYIHDEAERLKLEVNAAYIRYLDVVFGEDHFLVLAKIWHPRTQMYVRHIVDGNVGFDWARVLQHKLILGIAETVDLMGGSWVGSFASTELVEEDPKDANLLQRVLRELKIPPRSITVEDYRSTLDTLRHQQRRSLKLLRKDIPQWRSVENIIRQLGD